MPNSSSSTERMENHTPTQQRAGSRPHRLTRWLGTVVALLIVIVVLGIIGLSHLHWTNQSLGHVSQQLAQANQQRSQVLNALHAIQISLNALLARVTQLLHIAQHTA